MALRSRSVFALVSVAALAACQGGGTGFNGPSGLPSVNSAATMGNSNPLRTSDLLSSAPHGARTYVHLPLRNSAQLDRLIQEQSTKNSPMFHRFLTVAQFREQYGPTAADLQKAAGVLRADGFKTTITSQGVIADAPQAVVERAFHVRLQMRPKSARLAGTPSLVADRAPTIPAALSSIRAEVAAFAPLPQAQPQLAMVSKTPINPENRYGRDMPFYWFDDLKQAYTYPSYTVANGSGRKIAILAVSKFLQSDVDAYFGHENLAPPRIVRRPVDGGPPPFDINNGASDEVSLDIQQAGGSAPGATLIVYGAPDASFTPSFIDMYTAVDEDNRADVVTTSFGLCELYFLPRYNNGQSLLPLLRMFHDLFRQGNAQGISFLNSSGDNGAQGGECTDVSGSRAIFGVSVFANDPNVTGVGGTNLQTSSIPNSLRSTYKSENAFHDAFAPGNGFAAGALWGSGGGRSVIWSKPPYQHYVNTNSSTRAVPDLAMMMGGCPFGGRPRCTTAPYKPLRSAFVTALGGAFYLLIGTSGSSPEFAGLQAVQDQVLGGRAGNVNYLIYTLAKTGSIGNGPIFHNDIPGNNGYVSHQGYNFVVGNGTPYGSQYALSPFAALAGNPQTPSNP